MGGLDDVLLTRYAGIDTMGDTLALDPCLPEELPGLRLPIVYRGRRMALDLTHESVGISLDGESAVPLDVVVQGIKHTLLAGDSQIRLKTDT